MRFRTVMSCCSRRAGARGFLLRGGEIDTERMARILLDEFRGGVLGRITPREAGINQHFEGEPQCSPLVLGETNMTWEYEEKHGRTVTVRCAAWMRPDAVRSPDRCALLRSSCPPGIVIEGLNDSKKLSEKKREKLFRRNHGKRACVVGFARGRAGD